MTIIEIEKQLKNKLDFDGMIKLSSLTVNGRVKCEDLICLCDNPNQQVAFRASWVLEFFAHANSELFLPHLSSFLALYPKVTNRSVQRCFTKVVMMLTEKKFTLAQKLAASKFDECLSTSFDWLMDPKTPVAIQANALELIFQLSPHHDWVLEELKVILQQKLVSGSPALVSRAKIILKKIN